MRKQHFSLLLILTVIAAILVAGCNSPTQTNVAPTANLTENTSTSASTNVSSAVSPTPTASPSPTPTVAPSSSPTSTPTPSSGKIATAIYGVPDVFDTGSDVKRGSSVTAAFNVVIPGTTENLCGVPLTASIDGTPAGKITPQASSGCFKTANYELSADDTNKLTAGTHTLTVSYAGDNTYEHSDYEATFKVT